MSGLVALPCCAVLSCSGTSDSYLQAQKSLEVQLHEAQQAHASLSAKAAAGKAQLNAALAEAASHSTPLAALSQKLCPALRSGVQCYRSALKTLQLLKPRPPRYFSIFTLQTELLDLLLTVLTDPKLY